MRHHAIISGTGRAGTTFLVQLLTELGLDTGFTPDNLPIDDKSNAGLEWDIREQNVPYIIKSPFLCDYLEEAIIKHNVVIDYAFIPIRDLQAASKSRIRVQGNSTELMVGGVWDSNSVDYQPNILAKKLYNLVYILAKYNVDITFLSFPRIVYDPVYLYSQMKPILKNIGYQKFTETFDQVANTELIHIL